MCSPGSAVGFTAAEFWTTSGFPACALSTGEAGAADEIGDGRKSGFCASSGNGATEESAAVCFPCPAPADTSGSATEAVLLSTGINETRPTGALFDPGVELFVTGAIPTNTAEATAICSCRFPGSLPDTVVFEVPILVESTGTLAADLTAFAPMTWPVCAGAMLAASVTPVHPLPT